MLFSPYTPQLNGAFTLKLYYVLWQNGAVHLGWF